MGCVAPYISNTAMASVIKSILCLLESFVLGTWCFRLYIMDDTHLWPNIIAAIYPMINVLCYKSTLRALHKNSDMVLFKNPLNSVWCRRYFWRYFPLVLLLKCSNSSPFAPIFEEGIIRTSYSWPFIMNSFVGCFFFWGGGDKLFEKDWERVLKKGNLVI